MRLVFLLGIFFYSNFGLGKSSALVDLNKLYIRVKNESFCPKLVDQLFSKQMARANKGNLSDILYDNDILLNILSPTTSGVINPEKLSPDVRIKKKLQIQNDFVSSQKKGSESLIEIYEKLSSKLPEYIALKKFLNQRFSNCESKLWKQLPKLKKSLSFGDRGPFVSALKERLWLLGYNVDRTSDIFDQSMLLAVQDVQQVLGLQPDGVISPNRSTWKYLNTSCKQRKKTILLDMEKLRWFPQSYPDRHIFINLASSWGKLVDQGKSEQPLLEFRVINGRPQRKTPTMLDQILELVINPEWIVPPTIFREDKVSEIRDLHKDKINQYFKELRFELWSIDRNHQLDPKELDWGLEGEDPPGNVLIIQKPHQNNVLGTLKFIMTNNNSVYLHDTNQKILFQLPQRQLSSGCIRLEKPLDLAEYLMLGSEWTREKINSKRAITDDQASEELVLKAPKPLDVYLIFLTSEVGKDRVIRFYKDTYGLNKKIQKECTWGASP